MPHLTAPSIPQSETAYLADAVALGRANEWSSADEAVKGAALRESAAFLNERFSWSWGESDEVPQQVVRGVAIMALALLRGHGVENERDRVVSETYGPISTTFRAAERAEVPDDVIRAIGGFGELIEDGGSFLF